MEKINGRTPEEIKRVLEWATCACGDMVCEECQYYEIVCSHENFERIAPDALALIQRLESERDAALAKLPKWISVKERLPETPGHYLCWLAFAEGPTPMHVSYLGDGKWTLPARLISHWREPMEPPKEEENERVSQD